MSMNQEDYNELIAKNMPQWQKDQISTQMDVIYDAEIIAKLQTEIADFKLLELSLGKRIEDLISDVNEYEAKNKALLKVLKDIIDCDEAVEDYKTIAREAIQGDPVW